MSPQNIRIGSSCLACTSAPTWKDASLPAGPPSSAEFSLGVPATSRAEVDQLLAQAEAAGGTVTAPAHMRPFGVYPGYFTDPDGRGDVVVPLTGLATAIRAAGHSVTIASNDEYEGLVVGCGLEFRALPGTQHPPNKLMLQRITSTPAPSEPQTMVNGHSANEAGLARVSITKSSADHRK
jgi:hypothetical protein